MKKLLLVFILGLVVQAAMTQSVPNSGFENLNSKGNISHWGIVKLFNFSLDSIGNRLDSIVFDGPFYAPTSDAHTGSQAMEMRNAYDFKQNVSYTGGANLSNNDSDYSAFGTTLVQVQSHVTDFSFYYKYFPVNNDSAVASIEAFDSNGMQIGEARVILSGLVNTYSLAKTRINFTLPGTVAYVSIHFSTFYSQAYTVRQASFGTRLLVDDVVLSNTSDIDPVKVSRVTLYPNPARDFISISSDEPILGIKVYDLCGREIEVKQPINDSELDLQSLSPGDYLIAIITATAVLAKKIIVE
jgi:hypothetical protein